MLTGLLTFWYVRGVFLGQACSENIIYRNSDFWAIIIFYSKVGLDSFIYLLIFCSV